MILRLISRGGMAPQLELSRLEARLRLLIAELEQKLTTSSQQQAEMQAKLNIIQEKLRTLVAKDEMKKARKQLNPVFETDEECDGSV